MPITAYQPVKSPTPGQEPHLDSTLESRGASSRSNGSSLVMSYRNALTTDGTTPGIRPLK
jgi:hypothetical protein